MGTGASKENGDGGSVTKALLERKQPGTGAGKSKEKKSAYSNLCWYCCCLFSTPAVINYTMDAKYLTAIIEAFFTRHINAVDQTKSDIKEKLLGIHNQYHNNNSQGEGEGESESIGIIDSRPPKDFKEEITAALVSANPSGASVKYTRWHEFLLQQGYYLDPEYLRDYGTHQETIDNMYASLSIANLEHLLSQHLSPAELRTNLTRLHNITSHFLGLTNEIEYLSYNRTTDSSIDGKKNIALENLKDKLHKIENKNKRKDWELLHQLLQSEEQLNTDDHPILKALTQQIEKLPPQDNSQETGCFSTGMSKT